MLIVHLFADALQLVCALRLLLVPCILGDSSWNSWDVTQGLGPLAAVCSRGIDRDGGASCFVVGLPAGNSTHRNGVQCDETIYFLTFFHILFMKCLLKGS